MGGGQPGIHSGQSYGELPMKATGVGFTILPGGLIGSLRAPAPGVAQQPGLPAVDAVLDKYVAGLHAS
jgi:hypothetical protein